MFRSSCIYCNFPFVDLATNKPIFCTSLLNTNYYFRQKMRSLFPLLMVL